MLSHCSEVRHHFLQNTSGKQTPISGELVTLCPFFVSISHLIFISSHGIIPQSLELSIGKCRIQSKHLLVNTYIFLSIWYSIKYMIKV